MKVFYATMVIVAFAVAAEGAPQGFWDRLANSAGNAWDSTKDTARNSWDFTKDTASDSWDFTKGAVRGTGDMVGAYKDMQDSNWKNSDRYFHSRGNYDAAQRGPGGAWAAGVISNAREWSDQVFKGDSPADSARDQEANLWGRGGGDPNRYRPKGLPIQY